jgi:hypothetical protein
MDITIKYMLRPVAHCKEGCSKLSSDALTESSGSEHRPSGSERRGWARRKTAP